jgi:hypothetical protein
MCKRRLADPLSKSASRPWSWIYSGVYLEMKPACFQIRLRHEGMRIQVSQTTCSPSESAGYGSDDRRRMPPVRQAHAIITFSAVRCGYSGVRLTCALSALLLQAEER